MQKVLLTLQVSAAVRQQLKVLAAQRGVSVRELLEPGIRQILATSEPKPIPDHAPRKA